MGDGACPLNCMLKDSHAVLESKTESLSRANNTTKSPITLHSINLLTRRFTACHKTSQPHLSLAVASLLGGDYNSYTMDQLP